MTNGLQRIATPRTSTSSVESRSRGIEPLESRRLLDAIPVGSEFQVNTTTAGNQRYSTVATDADGDFVVAWGAPDGNPNQDGNGIFAQRYNSAGVAQGSEFRVNPTTRRNQQWPATAMDADGDFVVVWGEATPKNPVFGRRYNAAGVAQGSSFSVSTNGGGVIPGPEVAMDASGRFVVVWNAGDVFAQRYDAAGAPIGGQLRITNTTNVEEKSVDVAMDADGDFVVTWSVLYEGNVYARRYNSAGVAQGAEFQVNTSMHLDAWDERAAMDADGDFVIVWDLTNPANTIADVYAQRYDATGVPQGGEIQVNTYTADGQLIPDVSMDAVGNLVVAWQSYGQEAPGTNGIFAQCYDNSGMPLGSEFHVNTYTTLGQSYPAVAMDSTGDFVVTWQSNGQDGSDMGIYAQRFAPAPPASASTSPFGAAPARNLFGERLLGLEREDDLESILEL